MMFCAVLVATSANAEEPVLQVRARAELTFAAGNQIIAGTLHDENGAPVSGRRITARLTGLPGLPGSPGSAVVRSAITASDGRFRISTPAGHFQYQLEVEEDRNYAAPTPVQGEISSESTPAIGSAPSSVTASSTTPSTTGSTPSHWPYLFPPLATGLLLSAWWVHARGRSRRAPTQRGSASEQAVPPTVRQAPRPRFAALRSATEQTIAGIIVDMIHRRPIEGALVSLHQAQLITELRVDSNGRFESAPLAAGSLNVSVSARGYMSEKFTRTLPHHGELSGLEISLTPVRHRLLETLDQAARQRVPPPRPLVLTPRELAMRARPASPRLHRIADRVEQACYGAETPGEEILAALAPIFDEVRDELRDELRDEVRSEVPTEVTDPNRSS